MRSEHAVHSVMPAKAALLRNEVWTTPICFQSRLGDKTFWKCASPHAFAATRRPRMHSVPITAWVTHGRRRSQLRGSHLRGPVCPAVRSG
jgi:hypothetical protein